jgi:hypothetical protein
MQADAERRQSEWLQEAALDRYAIKGTDEDWQQALDGKAAAGGKTVSVKTGEQAGGGAGEGKKRKGGSGGGGGKPGKGARREKARK